MTASYGFSVVHKGSPDTHSDEGHYQEPKDAALAGLEYARANFGWPTNPEYNKVSATAFVPANWHYEHVNYGTIDVFEYAQDPHPTAGEPPADTEPTTGAAQDADDTPDNPD